MSVYEGIVHIRHPEPLHEPTWNYIVLSGCTFEGISFAFHCRKNFGAIHAAKTLPYLSLFMKMAILGLFFLWSFLN
jgi:hypothetical protein